MARHTPRWLLVCVVLLAQVVAGRQCSGCDMPCCNGDSAPGAAASAEACDVEGACPHCARSGDTAAPADAGEHPCRCLLESRDDAPGTVPVTGDAGSDAASIIPWETVATDLSGGSPAAGHPAGDLRPPTRPVRVLFGVWRN